MYSRSLKPVSKSEIWFRGEESCAGYSSEPPRATLIGGNDSQSPNRERIAMSRCYQPPVWDPSQLSKQGDLDLSGALGIVLALPEAVPAGECWRTGFLSVLFPSCSSTRPQSCCKLPASVPKMLKRELSAQLLPPLELVMCK